MSLFKKIVTIFITVIIFYSCKKDSFITNSAASLSVSDDTLKFDTVFTTAGSIIEAFKIFNLNNQKLKLSTVKLMGGNASSFKLNVDGISASEVSDVTIEANDSLYVFVQVNIDPGAGNLPFIIQDSVLINYNGNNKFVQLQAYGQNANFLSGIRISGNVTFTNNLPYVILGGLLIDSSAILNIKEGCKIYVHADAPIIVDGTLLVQGTRQQKVIFSGDRLDDVYKDLPAGWPGIYFRGNSKNNNLQFAVIKNAYQGLVAQDLSTTANPKIKISQCIIDNIYDAGILGINTTISADNTLISNCGSNILLAYGGNYMFTHCTVASFGSFYIEHKNPVLQVYNYVKQDNQTLTADLSAVFKNCIFWGDFGNVDNEVITEKKGSNNFNMTLDHSLYKVMTDPANTIFTTTIKNEDPLFDTVNTEKLQFDFHLQANSPAINSGVATAFPKDLDDNSRSNGLPDMGCFEK